MLFRSKDSTNKNRNKLCSVLPNRSICDKDSANRDQKQVYLFLPMCSLFSIFSSQGVNRVPKKKEAKKDSI